jgi:hypothetical protein
VPTTAHNVLATARIVPANVDGASASASIGIGIGTSISTISAPAASEAAVGGGRLEHWPPATAPPKSPATAPPKSPATAPSKSSEVITGLEHWSAAEVAEWLRSIGLAEYVPKFGRLDCP